MPRDNDKNNDSRRDRPSGGKGRSGAARGPEKTICPSEAARTLAGAGDFRPYMEPVRDAAAKLADAGRIEVTQKGEPVKIGEARGPIRLRETRQREDHR